MTLNEIDVAQFVIRALPRLAGPPTWGRVVVGLPNEWMMNVVLDADADEMAAAILERRPEYGGQRIQLNWGQHCWKATLHAWPVRVVTPEEWDAAKVDAQALLGRVR